MTIFEIFNEYGRETKAEVEDSEECKKILYYDFVHNTFFPRLGVVRQVG